MENLIIDKHFVTLLIHSNRKIGQGEAETLIRSALCFAGLEQWPGMSIELFDGNAGTLVMAKPLDRLSVCIADYALPFFNGLFTE